MKPLISCNMITRADLSRIPRIQRSIGSFQNQTYPRRELVIVVASSSGRVLKRVEDLLKRTRTDGIRIVPAGGMKTLGELRNLGIARSKGKFICQWDDDDSSHPSRLERQFKRLLKSGADGVVLGGALHYFSREKKCFWVDWSRSRYRGLPGTVMFKKRSLLNYVNLKTGEDTVFLYKLLSAGKVSTLKSGLLYLYEFHGGNAWSRRHHLSVAREYAAEKKRIMLHLKSIKASLRMFGVDPEGVQFFGSDSKTLGASQSATTL